MDTAHSPGCRWLAVLVATLVLASPGLVAGGPVAFTAQPWKVKKRSWAVACADLNRDGVIDIAALAKGKPSVLYGLGDGAFSRPVIVPGGSDSHALVVDDFNRDGWPDLAVIASAGVAIVRGGPVGQMVREPLVRVPHPFMGIVSGDLDGDGIPDLVVGRLKLRGDFWEGFRAKYYVVVCRGLGNGTFTELAEYDAKEYPSALALGDFDRDGVLDLAVSDRASAGAVMIRRGLGGGLLDESRSYPTPRPTGIVVADLDGNGWPDIALASDGQDAVGVLYGGTGGFAPVVTYPLGQLRGCIACADLNSDACPDLVACTGERAGAVVVLYGQEEGGFGQVISYPVGPDPRGVAVGDVDRDGRLDLVVTSYSTAALVVLRNQGAAP